MAVRPRAGRADPLRDLEMRLTYRTVRVLMAVAAPPGGSNRQVADVSGIADQGQISKLLARLHGLGLIENTGAPATRGAPNSWVLTDRGWEVQGAVARTPLDSVVPAIRRPASYSRSHDRAVKNRSGSLALAA